MPITIASRAFGADEGEEEGFQVHEERLGADRKAHEGDGRGWEPRGATTTAQRVVMNETGLEETHSIDAPAGRKPTRVSRYPEMPNQNRTPVVHSQ
jgi:hypothetical protein